jgi:SAM-dependent methyltransferase
MSAFPAILEGTILEVGAGEARIARAFPHLDVFSTDLVIDGIQDLGPRAAVCPISRLPFKDRSFDLVIALEVLEHLSIGERAAGIAQIHRTLKPDGLLLLSVPIWPISAFEWLWQAGRHRCAPSMANLGRWDAPHETRFGPGCVQKELQGFLAIGSRRWCKSASAVGLFVLNPLLGRLNLAQIDLSLLDSLLPFDAAANEVVLAHKVEDKT